MNPSSNVYRLKAGSNNRPYFFTITRIIPTYYMVLLDSRNDLLASKV